MIPNNLKVGDTFTEGNDTFEVTEVVSMFGDTVYNSRRIDRNAPAQAAEPTKQVKAEEIPAEDEKADIEPSAKLDSFNRYTKTEINRLSKEELEKVCDKLGLEKSTGTAMKKVIIDRLGL